MAFVRYPIIVLDGPDGSGKTTLGKLIAERHRGKYLHLTYRWKNNMAEYHLAALNYAAKHAVNCPVVIDRWWPSEVVYASVFRDGSTLTFNGRYLDRLGQKYGVSYVMCIPDNRAAYLENFERLKAEREEMYDTMAGVYDGYAKLALSLSPRSDMLLYDWKIEGRTLEKFADGLVNLAQLRLNHIRAVARSLDNNGCNGNQLNPRLRILTVKSEEKLYRREMPITHGTHSWITAALKRNNIPEYDVAWSDVTDRREVMRLISDTPRIKTVAANRIAADVASNWGVPFDDIIMKKPKEATDIALQTLMGK
jgi:hypothetical protein